MDAGYPQSYQLGAIGTYSLNGNDAVDEPAWPKKLKNYENVVFIEKTGKCPSHDGKNHAVETTTDFFL